MTSSRVRLAMILAALVAPGTAHPQIIDTLTDQSDLSMSVPPARGGLQLLSICARWRRPL